MNLLQGLALLQQEEARHRATRKKLRKANHVISDLMNALDTIRRYACEMPAKESKETCDFINGLAQQAMANCNTHRTRNSDGYLRVQTSTLQE